MTRPYELSRQAQLALDLISKYYFDRGGDRLANHVLGSVLTALDRIGELRQLGHHRADLTKKQYRFYRVFKYMIVYD